MFWYLKETFIKEKYMKVIIFKYLHDLHETWYQNQPTWNREQRAWRCMWLSKQATMQKDVCNLAVWWWNKQTTYACNLPNMINKMIKYVKSFTDNNK